MTYTVRDIEKSLRDDFLPTQSSHRLWGAKAILAMLRPWSHVVLTQTQMESLRIKFAGAISALTILSALDYEQQSEPPAPEPVDVSDGSCNNGVCEIPLPKETK